LSFWGKEFKDLQSLVLTTTTSDYVFPTRTHCKVIDIVSVWKLRFKIDSLLFVKIPDLDIMIKNIMIVCVTLSRDNLVQWLAEFEIRDLAKKINWLLFSKCVDIPNSKETIMLPSSWCKNVSFMWAPIKCLNSWLFV